MHAQATIGFGFTSDWLKKNGARTLNQSLSEVIINQSNSLIIFDAQLKTALTNQLTATSLGSQEGLGSHWGHNMDGDERKKNLQCSLQGAVLGPLFNISSLCLRLVLLLRGIACYTIFMQMIHRFIIMSFDSCQSGVLTSSRLEACIGDVSKCMSANRLRLNSLSQKKTAFSVFGSQFRPSLPLPSVRVNKDLINTPDSATSVIFYKH